MSDTQKYPDISDLIARKQKGRAEIKRLSFGEKIELIERMKEGLAPFKALREARKHAQKAQS
ncbi:MAG TPA: hypothetical protein VME47_03015 [Acetobacteraceae bacterium]|nr:hypothetical protein [Acetobacteraceae bacterium]